jgi:nicotinate phosphoribosyltransferase
MLRTSMHSGLATDLYELTMAAGYWSAGMMEPATFELFVRRLPPSRGYLIVAGLEQAIEYLEAVQFSAEDRAWLKAQPQFARIDARFFDDYLARFRFTGDVWAAREGTAMFAGEPILRVTAPLPEAQIVETALLSMLLFPTSVATKAARLLTAAGGRAVVDFGVRRAHGLSAGLAAARAAYVAGCAATSFVEASRRYHIPASGTMAHSWVQSFADEMDAFRTFERLFGRASVYLLDTYDTRTATKNLIDAGLEPPMVRLDSGDIESLSREVRRLLDNAGLFETGIFATGDLDEHAIDALVRAAAPIDGFGVGTSLATVSDAPSLSGVYKLVELHRGGHPVDVVKLSPGKRTFPGAKQVHRTFVGSTFAGDLVAAGDEPATDATAILELVVSEGTRVDAPETLDAIRERSRATLAALPDGVKRLHDPDPYPVRFSDRLERRREMAARRV